MSDTSTTTSKSRRNAGAVVFERIVFFDGMCGLCNHTVDFLLRRDTGEILKFSPLQGTTATQMLPQDVRNRLDTLVYCRNGQRYYRSTAVLRVLRDLGGFWGVLGMMLWIIPVPLRDVGYRCVSVWRYRIFGKREACRVPTAEERVRFLD